MKLVPESLFEGAWGHDPLDNDGASDWKWKFGDMILKELGDKIKKGLKAKENEYQVDYLYYALGMWDFFKWRLKTNYSVFTDEEIKSMDQLTVKAAEKLLEIDYASRYQNPLEVKRYLEEYIENKEDNA